MALKGGPPHIVAHTELAKIEDIALTVGEIGLHPFVDTRNRLFQVGGVFPHITHRQSVVIGNVKILVASAEGSRAYNQKAECFEYIFHNLVLLRMIF
jgi:hypothetical protein